MTADQHPALITEDSGLPSLTLVLPGDAGQVLTGLALAISKTRQTMAGWVEAFRRRRVGCAASGGQLGQAMARGQVVTGEHVIDHLDENIAGVFGLWDPVRGPGSPARRRAARRAPSSRWRHRWLGLPAGAGGCRCPGRSIICDRPDVPAPLTAGARPGPVMPGRLSPWRACSRPVSARGVSWPG
jgi:hypothetical protein